MTGFILGKKGKMSQIFTEDGIRIPVTHIDTKDCYLINVKTKDADGYTSIVFGFGKKRRISKPVAGQLKKVAIKDSLAFIKEIRLKQDEDAIQFDSKTKTLVLAGKDFKLGTKISPDTMFEKQQLVAITGHSKGKGFAGVVKRHHFAGGPRTHGQSDRERAPGSIGQTTTPGRVYKGKRMAGRMGGETITTKNLSLVDISDDKIVVKGAVPGPIGGYLIIRS